ncbi:MAG: Rrf2 family transcriptional regulator [Betaproteobacteria bacterium]|nr:Rrf2 family transcriptional regulator [Betaproteobacteria bacterium]
MILSRASQYAIQAVILMAMQPHGTFVLNRELAEQLNVPAPYLAKVLQALVRGSLLYSSRGRNGGFCLREGVEKVDLMQILLHLEGPQFTDTCLLGLKECTDETACPIHKQWKPIKHKLARVLRTETPGKLARAVKTGKYRLADLPMIMV